MIWAATGVHRDELKSSKNTHTYTHAYIRIHKYTWTQKEIMKNTKRAPRMSGCGKTFLSDDNIYKYNLLLLSLALQFLFFHNIELFCGRRNVYLKMSSWPQPKQRYSICLKLKSFNLNLTIAFCLVFISLFQSK